MLLWPVEFPGKLPSLVDFLLMLLLAWIITGWFVFDTPKMKVVELSQLSRLSLPDMAEIQGNIFGAPSAKSAASKPVVMPVVKSPLNIRLLGTVVAGENSAALIAMQGKKEQKVFFVGGSLQPGVKLHEILADAIVLDRGGSLEKVMMEKSGGLAATPLLQTLQPGAQPIPAAKRPKGRAVMPNRMPNGRPGGLPQTRMKQQRRSGFGL